MTSALIVLLVVVGAFLEGLGIDYRGKNRGGRRRRR